MKTESKFRKSYQNKISENSLEIYCLIIRQIEGKNLVINSKSKEMQVNAVLNHCKEANIPLNYKLIKTKKRGDKVKENILDKYIDKKHLETILKSTPNTPTGYQLRQAIRISYYSGLRLSEVLNLTKADIKINGHIVLTVKGKNDKTRKAYLPLEFKDEILSFDGFTITAGYAKTIIHRIADKTGINFSFHSLRHSFASNCINEMNMSLPELQMKLGHESIQTTSIYIHCTDTPGTLEKHGY